MSHKPVMTRYAIEGRNCDAFISIEGDWVRYSHAHALADQLAACEKERDTAKRLLGQEIEESERHETRAEFFAAENERLCDAIRGIHDELVQLRKYIPTCGTPGHIGAHCGLALGYCNSMLRERDAEFVGSTVSERLREALTKIDNNRGSEKEDAYTLYRKLVLSANTARHALSAMLREVGQ